MASNCWNGVWVGGASHCTSCPDNHSHRQVRQDAQDMGRGGGGGVCTPDNSIQKFHIPLCQPFFLPAFCLFFCCRIRLGLDKKSAKDVQSAANGFLIFCSMIVKKLLFKFCLLLWNTFLLKAASKFPSLSKFLYSLTCPQRKFIRNLPVFSKEGFGTLFRMFSATFRKPSVILKSNTVTRFKLFLNFPPSSLVYGKIYRIIQRVTVLLFTITVGFLNATLNILKRVPKPSLENTGCIFFEDLSKNTKIL